MDLAAPTVDPVIGTAGPPLDPATWGQASGGAKEERRQAEIAVNPVQRFDRPLLFVDVDGVISLFGFPPDRRPAGSWLNVDGIPHLISATAAEHLHRLGELFELVWCTGWEEKADEHLTHLLHLPVAPPFLTFSAPPGSAHWKLDTIQAHAGRRPLAWIDDTFDESCHAWAAARGAPTLLVATEAAVGMQLTHVVALERWARALG
ncbi:MAG: hypothetical protein QOC64_1708 [Solirubrobacteraceae bacterium]|nr:hypothetical protein [Solirubrobacteraceae bacterium]